MKVTLKRNAERPADIRDLVRRHWMALLDVDHVNPESDFFALGGDSLKAARIIAALQRETGVRLPVSSLFANPTFEVFSDLVLRGNDQP